MSVRMLHDPVCHPGTVTYQPRKDRMMRSDLQLTTHLNRRAEGSNKTRESLIRPFRSSIATFGALRCRTRREKLSIRQRRKAVQKAH